MAPTAPLGPASAAGATASSSGAYPPTASLPDVPPVAAAQTGPRATLGSLAPTSGGQPQAAGSTGATASGRVSTTVAVVIVLFSALLGAACAMLYLKLLA